MRRQTLVRSILTWSVFISCLISSAQGETQPQYSLEMLDQAWANQDYAYCEKIIAALREDPINQELLDQADLDLGMANILSDAEVAREHLSHFLLGGPHDNSPNAERARLSYARLLGMEGRFAESQALLLTLTQSADPSIVYQAYQRACEFGNDSDLVADTWLVALEAAWLQSPEPELEAKILAAIDEVTPETRLQYAELKKLARKGKQDFYGVIYVTSNTNRRSSWEQVEETWSKVLSQLPDLDPVTPPGDPFLATAQIDARFFLGTAKLNLGDVNGCRNYMEEIQAVTWSTNDKIGTSYTWTLACDSSQGFSPSEIMARIKSQVCQENLNPLALSYYFKSYAEKCRQEGAMNEGYAALRDWAEIMPNRKHTVVTSKLQKQWEKENPELPAVTAGLQSQLRTAMHEAGKLDYYEGKEVLKQWKDSKKVAVTSKQ